LNNPASTSKDESRPVKQWHLMVSGVLAWQWLITRLAWCGSCWLQSRLSLDWFRTCRSGIKKVTGRT